MTRERSWANFLAQEASKPYFQDLEAYVANRRQQAQVFPPAHQVFRAFDLTPYDAVKVVLLGQDPYHGQGQANGLSFSVSPGTPIPKSLNNMFRELVSDLGLPYPQSGDLTPWAKQGVLLLNTVLTVEEGQANAHKNRGWEIFTDAAIDYLNQREAGVIFLLWGKQAKEKAKRITNPQHRVLTAPHPSPLSAYRGFFGSRPYSQVNAILLQQGQDPIDWRL